MKKALLLIITSLLFSVALAKVNITITYDRPGGWQADGRGFYLKCVDPFTGLVVHMDDTLTEGEVNSFKVDNKAHPQIVCWVFSYMQQGHYMNSLLVSRKKIETRNYYENGYCGNSIVLPSEEAIGVCGDGNITGMESCDTNGNKGCAPPTPKCYNCQFCGCEKDSDCPQVTGTHQCGFGKCAPEERPMDVKNICYQGKCILTYKCFYDVTCTSRADEDNSSKGVCLTDPEKVIASSTITGFSDQTTLGNESFETMINDNLSVIVNEEYLGVVSTKEYFSLTEGSLFVLMSIDNKTADYYIIPNNTLDQELNIKFFDDFGGADLEEIINYLNSNLELIPPQVVSIFGNERINLYLEGANGMFMETIDGKVMEMGSGLLSDPTMNFYTSIEVINGLQDGTTNIMDALLDGRIKYESTTLFGQFKLFFVNIGISILSFFGII